MQPISRAQFLKRSMQVGGSLFLTQLPFSSFAQTSPIHELMQRMVVANDENVKSILALSKQNSGRRLGQDMASLAAAYVSPTSKYFHTPDVVVAIQSILEILTANQTEDGTLTIGNLESPPDTAFLLESTTASANILRKDGSEALKSINATLKTFIQKAAHGLIVGGVHTPNHRWVVCAALAKINRLYPDPKIISRINDWLGEGIFIDADGHFPERSQNYAAVEVNSLITMAIMLNKNELLAPVRRNLDMTFYYMEPNGDLVVNDSRRQDQWSSIRMPLFYFHYRYMAIHDKNGQYASIARFMETLPDFELFVVKRNYYQFLDEPMLQEELPVITPPSVHFEKLFPTSSLLRIRRNDMTATLFGGADLPLLIASGRSCSPNIFSYRKGEAILKYLRLSTSFFSTGYFYSNGLKKTSNGYVLHSQLAVPYYQPLPKDKRRQDGDYTLSPSIDDRFWNKMDFKNRPVSNVKSLDTTVTLNEQNGKVDLKFDVQGPKGVLVTIELCFKEGGKLSGVQQGMGDNLFLEAGEGVYTFGKDTIHFGPGANEHKMVVQLEGERYATHFGSLSTEGMHVFITGKTPFTHTLTFG